MTRTALPLLPMFLAGPAFAHPGHLADLAGHDHWVAGAAIGLAIALGLWGALKDKTGKTEESTEADEDADAEEVKA